MRIDDTIRVTLSQLLSFSIHSLNDYTSECLTGSRVALNDIGYTAIEVDGDQIVLRVTGEIDKDAP